MRPSSKRNNTFDARIVVGKTAALGCVSCCSLRRSRHVRLSEGIRGERVAAVAESAPDRPGAGIAGSVVLLVATRGVLVGAAARGRGRAWSA
jgi:hypothetical protein